MKYLIWLIVIFAAAVALNVGLNNPAYVMLVYPPYRLEMSLTLFVIVLSLAFILGYILIRLIFTTLKLPTYVRQFRLGRSQAHNRKLLDKTLDAYFEGRYADAEKSAVRAIKSGATSALHPIIAARSAHELHEYQKRDAYLSAAADKKIGSSTMRLLAATKFKLDQRDPHAALGALQELHSSGVKDHLGAMTLELKAHQQTGNWDQVLALLNQLEKHSSLESETAQQLRQQAWLGKIRQQNNLTGLVAAVKSAPAELKRRSIFAATSARALIQHGDCALAQQMLSNSLNAQWDSELVALYGDCQGADVVAQIEQAEKWLVVHKQEAGLLLALGKLCLHQKLWGKARSYLDASISLEPSHAAYTALGQLAEGLGKPEEAHRYFQSAMDLSKK